jgi:hypothetical protein
VPDLLAARSRVCLERLQRDAIILHHPDVVGRHVLTGQHPRFRLVAMEGAVEKHGSRWWTCGAGSGQLDETCARESDVKSPAGTHSV